MIVMKWAKYGQLNDTQFIKFQKNITLISFFLSPRDSTIRSSATPTQPTARTVPVGIGSPRSSAQALGPLGPLGPLGAG